MTKADLATKIFGRFLGKQKSPLEIESIFQEGV